jgi:hypothetical protein
MKKQNDLVVQHLRLGMLEFLGTVPCATAKSALAEVCADYGMTAEGLDKYNVAPRLTKITVPYKPEDAA